MTKNSLSSSSKLVQVLCLLLICFVMHVSAFVTHFRIAHPSIISTCPRVATTFQQYMRSQEQRKNRMILFSGDGGSLHDDSSNNSGNSNSNSKWKVIVPVVAFLAILGIVGVNHGGGIDFGPILERTVAKIASLGPLGYLYFAMVYIIVEVLAIPAMPLTASSGYLFGLFPGFLTVLISATIGSCISFFIGRTLLREWALKMTSGSAKWRAIDKAIGRSGFKVILLLRMSPLLPFAISNYLYGLTSVDFWSYLAATFIGFAPGTLGVVYAGSAGKALFSAGMSSLPWYAYAGGGALLILFGNTVAKVATDVLKQMQAEDAAESTDKTPKAAAGATA